MSVWPGAMDMKCLPTSLVEVLHDGGRFGKYDVARPVGSTEE